LGRPRELQDVAWNSLEKYATQAPEKKQDWNDPEVYKDAECAEWPDDGGTYSGFPKKKNFNDSDIYKDMDWATVHNWITVSYGDGAAAPATSQTPVASPAEESAEGEKPGESSGSGLVSPTASRTTTTRITVETPTFAPSQAATNGNDVECSRFGPILNAAISSCTTRCTQHDDRTSSLVGKMKALDCEINLYVMRHSCCGSPKNVSCSTLTNRLAIFPKYYDNCGSDCLAWEENVNKTSDRIKQSSCETNKKSAKPHQRRESDLDAMTKTSRTPITHLSLQSVLQLLFTEATILRLVPQRITQLQR